MPIAVEGSRAARSSHPRRRPGSAGRGGCRTAQRYIDAAEFEGLARTSHPSALTDELIAAVKARIRPGNPRPPKGAARRLCEQHRDDIAALVADGVKATKIRVLLARNKQAEVPYRTLARFIRDELRPPPKATVRLDDPPPGQEVQVDFGKMGRVTWDGRRRDLWALIFTAAASRHTFVWLTLKQTTAAFIAGSEAAWRFFGGVFPVMISDNASALVSKADPLTPTLTDAFLDYCQARGFVFDATRPRDPTGKARVERAVRYVRQSFFAGETFVDLGAAQRAAVAWSREADEVQRRAHKSADDRAKKGQLDPKMRLENWDPTARVTFDQPLWNELVSLRFVDSKHHVLILGPVGVGKTFMANALGHIACRRGKTVMAWRTDRLLEHLKASRLDNSYERELRKLVSVDLLILDDFCLDQLDGTESRDVYELIDDRHQRGSMAITSHREPMEGWR